MLLTSRDAAKEETATESHFGFFVFRYELPAISEMTKPAEQVNAAATWKKGMRKMAP